MPLCKNIQEWVLLPVWVDWNCLHPKALQGIVVDRTLSVFDPHLVQGGQLWEVYEELVGFSSSMTGRLSIPSAEANELLQEG